MFEFKVEKIIIDLNSFHGGYHESSAPASFKMILENQLNYFGKQGWSLVKIEEEKTNNVARKEYFCVFQRTKQYQSFF